MTPEELMKYYSLQIANAEMNVRYWQAMREEAQEAYDRVAAMREKPIADIVVGL